MLFFTDLYANVISAESVCIGCGACVLICPYNRLIYKDGKPEQSSGEKGVCPVNEEGKCGLCAEVCPQLPLVSKPVITDKEEHTRITSGRSTDPFFRKKGQDGGFVSGLAAWGLTAGRWRFFLGYTRDEEWQVLPFAAETREDVARTCGSKYTYASLIGGLETIRKKGEGTSPFAVVGLPCQIAAVRNLQRKNSKFTKNLQLCIGLFCSKAFSYSGLIKEKIETQLRIPVTKIEKMDIRKGRFTVELKDGTAREIPIKELTPYGHSGCGHCTDFAAEQADISVGGLGIGEWTLAITRTAAGDEVLEAARAAGDVETAPAEDFPKALELLGKMSDRKRRQAEQT